MSWANPAGRGPNPDLAASTAPCASRSKAKFPLLVTNRNLLGVGWLERAGATNLYDTTKQDLITYSIPHDTVFLSSSGKAVLGAYAFMSNGVFAFIKHSGLSTRTQLKGRGAAMPAAAAAFTILLFALGGIPPTGGFIAKLLLLWRAVDAGMLWPAAIGALSALISLSYYLGMTRELWFDQADASVAVETGRGASLVIACAAGVLLLMQMQ